MHENFHAVDRWTKRQVHCVYQALIVAISTRHADAIDIKFLVDGCPVWVALPHTAWVEYNQRTGKMITDPLAVEIAGHYLKTALESGERSEEHTSELQSRPQIVCRLLLEQKRVKKF